MVDMNGAAIQSMTYNGVEVQTWTHDGVEVYSASKPWIAYEKVDNQMVANSPAAIPSYAGTFSAQPGNLLWQVNAQYYGAAITSRNVDNTEFLPTNKCKYMDVVVRSDINSTSKCTITGKKNGVETVIRTITVPKFADNVSNVVEGVTYNQYTHLISGVDVANYDSVKIKCESTVYDMAYIGLGYTKFYN